MGKDAEQEVAELQQALAATKKGPSTQQHTAATTTGHTSAAQFAPAPVMNYNPMAMSAAMMRYNPMGLMMNPMMMNPMMNPFAMSQMMGYGPSTSGYSPNRGPPAPTSDHSNSHYKE